MRHVFAGLVLMALAGCGNGAPEPPVSSAAPLAPALGMYGTDAHLASSKPDAVLRYADHPRGVADLRLPEGKGPFPLAVIFHGGCWKAGIADRNYMAPLATRWQQLGIATLNVDYREVGDGGGWPGSFADWKAAAGLIEQVARDYPIDRDRVTLVGHSAGATAALWLAAAQGGDGPAGVREPVKAHGVIALDGAGDLGRDQPAFDGLCGFAAVAPFMGGPKDEQVERYAAISPDGHPPHVARVLFVQAVLPSPEQKTLAALGAGGAAVEVLANLGASHFEIITPGEPTYAKNEPAMLGVLRGE